MRLLLLFLALSAAPATAQGRPVNEGWGLNVGAGGLVGPTYEGDDTYRLSVLPNIQITYGDRFFGSVQEGVGYRLVNSATLRAGPIGRIRFSRNADGNQAFAITGDDTTDLVGLGDVGTSIEIGGFAEYEFGQLTFGAEGRQAMNGHEGLVGDLSMRWSGRSALTGLPIFWSIGPRAKLVDDRFNTTYFGVTSTQSAASGLPTYEAKGGLYSYGVGATAIMPLDRDNRWTAIVFAGYDHLTGDAADSPLVQLRGSEDQATLGLFLSYRLL